MTSHAASLFSRRRSASVRLGYELNPATGSHAPALDSEHLAVTPAVMCTTVVQLSALSTHHDENAICRHSHREAALKRSRRGAEIRTRVLGLAARGHLDVHPPAKRESINVTFGESCSLGLSISVK